MRKVISLNDFFKFLLFRLERKLLTPEKKFMVLKNVYGNLFLQKLKKKKQKIARTKNKVKVGEKEGEWFETTKGVRQDCPLSFLLFTIICGRRG
jgi:hypothetical protein